MKIGIKIGVGFGGLIILLLVVGVVGIASLRQTIEMAQNINQAATGIASVSQNVDQAALASSGIASDIASVNAASQDVAVVVEQVNSQTMELLEMRVELKGIVERYKL